VTLKTGVLSRKFSFDNTGINDFLKSTYHGFLKMTVHMVWDIALRE